MLINAKKIIQNIQEISKFRKFTLPKEINNSGKIQKAINIIEKRWPEPPYQDSKKISPVFIFSAGWRSGSTLMQRLVVSSKEIVIWGEPFDDSAIIPILAHSITTITPSWPDSLYFEGSRNLSEMKNQWIANLSPPFCYLKASHRVFYKKWLEESAREQYGAKRWGLKEVRLTIDHARYLKWLFPRAKFIFIYRNPYHAYRSWKGNRWGSTWPGYYSRSPIVFARHWRTLLEGYLDGYKEVDGMIISFEKLVNREMDLNIIARHIGVKNIDENVLSKKLDSYEQRKKSDKKVLSKIDIKVLKTIGGKLIGKLGYDNI